MGEVLRNSIGEVEEVESVQVLMLAKMRSQRRSLYLMLICLMEKTLRG